MAAFHRPCAFCQHGSTLKFTTCSRALKSRHVRWQRCWVRRSDAGTRVQWWEVARHFDPETHWLCVRVGRIGGRRSRLMALVLCLLWTGLGCRQERPPCAAWIGCWAMGTWVGWLGWSTSGKYACPPARLGRVVGWRGQGSHGRRDPGLGI